jgi:hypothetical protein
MSTGYPIERDDRVRSFTVAAAQTVFGPFTFKVWDRLDLVFETMTGPSNTWVPQNAAVFTLTGAAPNTFTATLAGLATGTSCRVRGRKVPERKDNATRGGAISSQALEADLDRINTILQEVRRDADTALDRQNTYETRLANDEADIVELQGLPQLQGPPGVSGGGVQTFESQAAAAAFAGTIAGNAIEVLGHAAVDVWGRAPYKKVVSAPAHAFYIATAASQYFENQAGWLTPQMRGAKGDLSDDTNAFQDWLTALKLTGRPGFLPKASNKYAVSPLSIIGHSGLKIVGAGRTAAYLTPVSNSQPHILYIDPNSLDVSITDIGFFDGSRAVANRANYALLSDCYSELEFRRFRADGFINGVRLRAGTFCHVSDGNIRDCRDNYLWTGGLVTAQFSVCSIERMKIELGSGTTDPSEMTGTSVLVDSNSAHMYMERVTGVGTTLGIRIAETQGFGSGSNPDGIYITHPNFDYTGAEALLIEDAFLVDILNGKFRSLGGFAGRAQNFTNLQMAKTGFYASSAGGFHLDGDFGSFVSEGNFYGGNGWPDNDGGIDFLMSGGGADSALYSKGDRFGSGSGTGLGDFPYLNVANIADVGFKAEVTALAKIDMHNAKFGLNNVASHQGLVTAGVLRANTRLVDCDGFRTDNNGAVTATTDGSGNVLIPHGLALPPNYKTASISTGGKYAAVTSFDGTNLQVTVTDAAGVAQTAQTFDFNWIARV